MDVSSTKSLLSKNSKNRAIFEDQASKIDQLRSALFDQYNETVQRTQAIQQNLSKNSKLYTPLTSLLRERQTIILPINPTMYEPIFGNDQQSLMSRYSSANQRSPYKLRSRLRTIENEYDDSQQYYLTIYNRKSKYGNGNRAGNISPVPERKVIYMNTIDEPTIDENPYQLSLDIQKLHNQFQEKVQRKAQAKRRLNDSLDSRKNSSLYDPINPPKSERRRLTDDLSFNSSSSSDIAPKRFQKMKGTEHSRFSPTSEDIKRPEEPKNERIEKIERQNTSNMKELSSQKSRAVLSDVDDQVLDSPGEKPILKRHKKFKILTPIQGIVNIDPDSDLNNISDFLIRSSPNINASSKRTSKKFRSKMNKNENDEQVRHVNKNTRGIYRYGDNTKIDRLERVRESVQQMEHSIEEVNHTRNMLSNSLEYSKTSLVSELDEFKKSSNKKDNEFTSSGTMDVFDSPVHADLTKSDVNIRESKIKSSLHELGLANKNLVSYEEIQRKAEKVLGDSTLDRNVVEKTTAEKLKVIDNNKQNEIDVVALDQKKTKHKDKGEKNNNPSSSTSYFRKLVNNSNNIERSPQHKDMVNRAKKALESSNNQSPPLSMTNTKGSKVKEVENDTFTELSNQEPSEAEIHAIKVLEETNNLDFHSKIQMKINEMEQSKEESSINELDIETRKILEKTTIDISRFNKKAAETRKLEKAIENSKDQFNEIGNRVQSVLNNPQKFGVKPILIDKSRQKQRTDDNQAQINKEEKTDDSHTGLSPEKRGETEDETPISDEVHKKDNNLQEWKSGRSNIREGYESNIVGFETPADWSNRQGVSKKKKGNYHQESIASPQEEKSYNQDPMNDQDVSLPIVQKFFDSDPDDDKLPSDAADFNKGRYDSSLARSNDYSPTGDERSNNSMETHHEYMILDRDDSFEADLKSSPNTPRVVTLENEESSNIKLEYKRDKTVPFKSIITSSSTMEVSDSINHESMTHDSEFFKLEAQAMREELEEKNAELKEKRNEITKEEREKFLKDFNEQEDNLLNEFRDFVANKNLNTEDTPIVTDSLIFNHSKELGLENIDSESYESKYTINKVLLDEKKSPGSDKNKSNSDENRNLSVDEYLTDLIESDSNMSASRKNMSESLNDSPAKAKENHYNKKSDKAVKKVIAQNDSDELKSDSGGYFENNSDIANISDQPQMSSIGEVSIISADLEEEPILKSPAKDKSRSIEDLENERGNSDDVDLMDVFISSCALVEEEENEDPTLNLLNDVFRQTEYPSLIEESINLLFEISDEILNNAIRIVLV